MTTGDLTRPIVGIENRTAAEVFDIMCDRIRRAHAREAGAQEPVAVPAKELYPAHPGALRACMAELDMWLDSSDALDEIKNQQSFGESIMLVVHELKRLQSVLAAAPVSPPAESGEVERLREALERIAALTPARANARDARSLHLTVSAIAETALASVPALQPGAVCPTCSGRGRIGGMVRFGDGEVDGVEAPCPDCGQAPQPAAHRRVQDAAPARPELDALIAEAKAQAPQPGGAGVPPSALDQPSAWWAETGTAGAGEGCNKPFWLRHEAVAYVRQHGGHVAPLFRHYETPPQAGMILMPTNATEEMLAATHDASGHMRLLEFTKPEERSKPFLIMRACYRAMVDHVRKGDA